MGRTWAHGTGEENPGGEQRKDCPCGPGDNGTGLLCPLEEVVLTWYVGYNPELCKQDPASKRRVLNKGPQEKAAGWRREGLGIDNQERGCRGCYSSVSPRGWEGPREGPRALPQRQEQGGRLGRVGETAHITSGLGPASFLLLYTEGDAEKTATWGRGSYI